MLVILSIFLDINECIDPQDNDCDNNNGTCFNNEGSFTCACKTGFTGDGKACEGK